MIESYFADLLQKLLISPAVSSFKPVKQFAGDEEGFVRVRCNLSSGDTFEFAEYVRIQKDKIHIVNYSYHWQASDDKMIKRWDNVRHHRGIKTFPHHVHIGTNKVAASSPMTLEKVLKDIEEAVILESESENLPED